MMSIQLCSIQELKLKDLYNALSVYAGENDLVISKIEKKKLSKSPNQTHFQGS